MKDNDIEDMLDLTFTVNEEVFGQVRMAHVCLCVFVWFRYTLHFLGRPLFRIRGLQILLRLWRVPIKHENTLHKMCVSFSIFRVLKWDLADPSIFDGKYFITILYLEKS